MKTLVVFYSRSGYTRRVAKQIAKAMDAVMLPLGETGDSRPGFFEHQCRRIKSAFGLGSGVHPLSKNLADYDLVVLGTPIRGPHLSSAVRAFARRHGHEIRRTAFFCTLAGPDDEEAFEVLEALIGHAPQATLTLTPADIDSGMAPLKISRFVAELRLSMAQCA